MLELGALGTADIEVHQVYRNEVGLLWLNYAQVFVKLIEKMGNLCVLSAAKSQKGKDLEGESAF